MYSRTRTFYTKDILYRRPNFPLISWFASIKSVAYHIHSAIPELLIGIKPMLLRRPGWWVPFHNWEKVRNPISYKNSQSICIEWRNWSIPWSILGKPTDCIHGSNNRIYDVQDDQHTSAGRRRRKGTIALLAHILESVLYI